MSVSNILNDTKKVLGLAEDYTPFDLDILLHLNSIAATLDQLGVTDSKNLEITKDTTWDQLFIVKEYNAQVRSYVYVKIRLLFDPPANSFLVTSLEKMVAEYEWRLNIANDED